MTCLLCQKQRGPLERVNENVWGVLCPSCGRYQFDSAFAELVKHGRARGDRDLLRCCVRLSAVVRDRDGVLTIRRNNYAAIADESE